MTLFMVLFTYRIIKIIYQNSKERWVDYASTDFSSLKKKEVGFFQGKNLELLQLFTKICKIKG